MKSLVPVQQLQRPVKDQPLFLEHAQFQGQVNLSVDLHQDQGGSDSEAILWMCFYMIYYLIYVYIYMYSIYTLTRLYVYIYIVVSQLSQHITLKKQTHLELQ